jgi:hypothetical protein
MLCAPSARSRIKLSPCEFQIDGFATKNTSRAGDVGEIVAEFI